MTEISDRYRDLATEFTRRVDAVPVGRWANPSPCEGWSARDVVRHVIDTHGAMPGYAGLSLSLTESVDDDPARAWAEARDGMQSLLDDPERAGRGIRRVLRTHHPAGHGRPLPRLRPADPRMGPRQGHRTGRDVARARGPPGV